jgi:hypothetical protein
MPFNRTCASYEVLQVQLKENPGFARRFKEIEDFTQRVVSEVGISAIASSTVIEIPVHVNVLYRTSTENVSNAQIQSQIDVLNEDFAASNADYTKTPSTFQSVRSGNINIKFVWSSTTGLTRKPTKKTSWQTNNDMKRTSRGGIDPTSPTTKLNVWVCNLSNSILGYAQFPGGSSATDGIVIDNNAFGRGNYNLFSAFNKGRTATHEVGHWLKLRHIWGDATCGNDQVNDTPVHNTSNGGCPPSDHRSTCSGTPLEMTMNYMDYTNDVCMYMFSGGQASRMRATFEPGNGRSSFIQ